MSSTPSQQPAKGSRRSGKKSRSAEKQEPTTSTLAASLGSQSTPPPAVVAKAHNKAQNRKVSHQNGNAQSDGFISDRGKQSNNRGDKTKGTPVKPVAYAGATFQQSPAASALPLPSFYSKSLPAGAPAPIQSGNTSSEEPQNPAPQQPAHPTSKRESTPCDFLFEAARQAKVGPRGDSPANRTGKLTVHDSPAGGSPAPRDGDGMFPFELEGAAIPGENGSPFATPYKDRMDALRSTRSTSQGYKSMDEAERKAKSEALKQLLMKSTAQDVTASGPGVDLNNPFNARAPYQNAANATPMQVPARPNSGPPLSAYQQHHPGYDQQHFGQLHHQVPPASVQTPKRPTSSRLRNVYGAQSEPEYAELSSDSAVSPPVSTARNKPFIQTNGQYGGPMHRPRPSVQQMEDDLRRVLKLDLTSRG